MEIRGDDDIDDMGEGDNDIDDMGAGDDDLGEGDASEDVDDGMEEGGANQGDERRTA